MIISNLLIIALLIAFTAFFVAYEFAIVKVRGTRIDQLVSEGNKNAIAAKTIVSNLDEYLSACQLGITVTALGLGWLGEPTVEHILHPLLSYFNMPESISSITSFIVAFASVTFIHVVVGELAPKTFAIQKAEEVTLLFARPMILFYKIMYPFIKALNGSARFIVGIFGLKPASEHEVAHSEEELQLIISESYKSGEINQSEYKYVNNIFEFDDRNANEIMVPRTEIIAFDISQSLNECLQIVTKENYTRYPVIDGEKDNIVGMVNMKEVFTEYIKGKNVETSIQEYVRPVIQVIESIPIHDLLLKMQKERVHMAILMDEYGGTAGLVTVEDILEEIVGEIRDEFDADEVPEINKISENKTIVEGKVLIDEINDLFGIDLDDSDMDTIGGWILSEKMDVVEGDKVRYDDYVFKVLEIDGYHIKSLEILKITNQESIA
ncbi:hemolysin family protein [Neobacillus drentensis]|uniref:hemolysin family protein n=1 Tax=Neobacillus drentensis TaxID=220684 RepID=UPI002865BC61|nr:hemolysin family protein [Neobacillus drentensis]MDR7236664.1 CBS domain containing-hemolysin-like protein [Neobacillus drentensis]